MLATLLSCLTLALGSVQAQSPPPWRANWVSHPALESSEQAVALFRDTFTLARQPARFPVAVSADNHFRLFVNGAWVGFGPQLGDVSHYRYDTLDLAAYLRPGPNVVAVQVINWGHYRMFGIQSEHTALLVQGLTRESDSLVTTRGYDNRWLTTLDPSITDHPVRWRVADPDIIGGLYANNPTDSFDAARHPWGWAERDFDTGSWVAAPFLEAGHLVERGSGFLWMLTPRTTPPQVRRPGLALEVRAVGPGGATEPYRRREAAPVPVPSDWTAEAPAAARAVTVPPHTTVRFLLDAGEVTLGYPDLRWRGGRGSTIRYTYAENLFAPDKAKIHRDTVEGMIAKGYFDIIKPDGSATERSYRPTWYRTFRYIEVAVTTDAEPLELYAPTYERVTSTIPMVAEWRSDDPRLDSVWAMGRRTVELCTQDYFLSDAYYETMQYVGDTKVHALAWQALTGDLRHTRNALLDFHRSRNAEGMLKSCAPLRYHFYHGSYSLIWVDMLADYLARSGDTAFVGEVAAGVTQTLDYFARHSDPVTGMLVGVPYKPFVDWYVGGTYGIDASGDDERSVPYALQYAHALQSAERLFDALAEAEPPRAEAYRFRARQYREEAARVVAAIRDHSYLPGPGLVAEQPHGAPVGQHATILGVLTGVVPAEDRARALGAALQDASLVPATYYFRYYLLEALRQNRTRFPSEARFAAAVDAALAPWYAIEAQGATTMVERFEDPRKPTRSEAHPWGASPALFVYSLLAGIDLEAPTTDPIRMAPTFGNLTHLQGYCPAYGPDAGVRFDLRRDGPRLTGTIEAQSRPVVLTWRGKTYRAEPNQRVVVGR